MNKKLILASLLCLGALVGCGGGDKPAPTPSNDPDPSVVEPTVEPTVTPTTPEVEKDPNGTVEAPLTVTEASAIAEALEESGYDHKTYSEKVCVITGKVTSVLKKGSGFTAVITDGTKEFTVYGGLTKEGVEAPVAGDIIIASGYIINFNGTFELSSNKISDTETIEVYYESVKHAEYQTSIKYVDLEGTENTNATVTGLPAKVNSGTVVEFTIAAKEGFKVGTVTVNGNVIALKDGKYSFVATHENVVSAIVVSNDTKLPVNLDIKPTVEANTTANKLEGDALATALNLDPTVFTVTYAKGGESNRNDCAIRTDGFRLYAMNNVEGNSLEFTLKDANATFGTINITFDTSKPHDTVKIYAGTTEVTAISDGVYEINANSFKIVNDNTEGSGSTQVRVKQIGISYLA